MSSAFRFSTSMNSSPVSVRRFVLHPMKSKTVTGARQGGEDRRLRLGTCMTTNHMLFEDEIKRVLEVPAEYRNLGLIPIRYPRASFGPGKRRLLAKSSRSMASALVYDGASNET